MGAYDDTLKGAPPLALRLRPGAHVGRYVIADIVGSGGMGVVYAARDPELDRNVALKLMYGERGAEGRARFVREARAIARLTHPNVVAIHDVGAHEDDLFIAMELVEGASLKEWLETPRTGAAILDVMAQAGRGLAASHAAGLVHRDFKPANMLVGNDGRVRVTDFGLAQLAGAAQGETASRLSPPLGDLTETGALLGTLAYMAPEQLRAGAIDARTDQWSFAVTLHEALFGVRPFRATSFADLEVEAAAGSPAPVRAAPAALRRVLERALAIDPAHRYPSMDALLADLGDDPRVRRRQLAVGSAALGAAALFAVAVAALAGGGGPRPDACAGFARELDGVWDPPRKAAVREAFLATGRPYAGAAWSAVEAQLDRYAGGWVEQRVAACRAGARGEQTREIVELRGLCLGERRAELAALARLYARGDEGVVEKAAAATQSLTPIDGCADLRALTARARPAGDPVTQARGAWLGALLAEARALRVAGKVRAMLDLARVAGAEARALGDRGGEGLALLLEGDGDRLLGSFKTAEEHLMAAVRAAEAGRDDETAAGAWTILLVVVGTGLGRHEEGLERGLFAAASIERLGGSAPLEATLANSRGLVLRAMGKLPEAILEYQRSLDIERRLLPDDDIRMAMTLNNLGNTLGAAGRYEESQQTLERALAVMTRTHGAEHPDVAGAEANLANALRRRGDYRGAEEHLRRALAVRERLGIEDPHTAQTVAALGIVQRLQRHLPDAEASFRRAAAMLEKTQGKDSLGYMQVLNGLAAVLIEKGEIPAALAMYDSALAFYERTHNLEGMATVLSNMGSAYTEQRQPDRALPLLARARAVAVEAFGPEHPMLGDVIGVTAKALAQKRRFVEAEREERAALTLLEKALGPDHPRLAPELRNLGGILGAKGRAVEALEAWRRALALDVKAWGPDHPDVAADLAGIAQAVRLLGRRR